ncbi:MAG: TatD family hydrolase, partial [FCB group bacterium]|nr:TatD family hydrolase [FCB group bacterium]
MYIDTHAHLNLEPFCKDPEPYIERAVRAGVRRIIVPGIDLQTSEKAIELADMFEPVYAAVGIHPQDSGKAEKGYLKHIESFLQHPKVLAIGEVGMDHFRDYAPRDRQLRVFREQAELARAYDRPLIVHNRAADEDTFSVLDETDHFRAQFHCYGSDAAFASRVLERGAYISFTGVITFSAKAAEILKGIPLDRVMTETDCPWMAPVPYRGKQNEPAYVVEVLRAYARIYDKTPEETSE